MEDSFVCPQCHRTHREPLEAAYALHVMCVDCAFEQAYRIESAGAGVVRAADGAGVVRAADGAGVAVLGDEVAEAA